MAINRVSIHRRCRRRPDAPRLFSRLPLPVALPAGVVEVGPVDYHPPTAIESPPGRQPVLPAGVITVPAIAYPD